MGKSGCLVVSLTVILTGMLAQRALGQIPVTDAANLAKNVMTSFQTAQSNINEARMIQQQINAYLQQAENLRRLPASLVNQIQNGMRDYRTIMATGQSLGYQISALQRQLDALNGAGKTATGTNRAVQNTVWIQRQQEATTTAIKSQAIESELQQQQSQVGTALSLSDTAAGNLDVTQASNQLLGIMAKQQAMTLQLQATEARVKTLEAARMAQAEADSQQQFGDWLTPTPADPTATRGIPVIEMK